MLSPEESNLKRSRSRSGLPGCGKAQRKRGGSFRRRRNDGNLAEPRVSTAVLHRPNPVAMEMPGFIGVFARRGQVAEREGLAPPDSHALTQDSESWMNRVEGGSLSLHSPCMVSFAKILGRFSRVEWVAKLHRRTCPS
jgi:hypothetical protein